MTASIRKASTTVRETRTLDGEACPLAGKGGNKDGRAVRAGLMAGREAKGGHRPLQVLLVSAPTSSWSACGMASSSGA